MSSQWLPRFLSVITFIVATLKNNMGLYAAPADVVTIIMADFFKQLSEKKKKSVKKKSKKARI